MAGRTAPHCLFKTELDVDAESAKQISASGLGLYFDWGPDSARYHSHLRERPKEDFPDWFRGLIERQVSGGDLGSPPTETIR
jgi:hypothetical protein